jgi:PAS domain-containing protein
MLLARSLRIAFLALLALHLISGFAAIALLGRMRPALEQILERNVVSLESVEEMLSVLSTQRGEAANAADAERFRRAFEIAESNVTESEEPALLAVIRRQSERALAGDDGAIAAVADAATLLGRSNRSAIEKANHDAQRLGYGGAWAVALLSFFTFGSGLLALRQLDRRVLAPLSELHEVLAAPGEGDHHRRCHAPAGTSDELAVGMRAVNHLLDALRAPSAAEDATDATVERATLLAILDALPDAAAIVDDEGEIIASNKQALELLADEPGDALGARLRAAAKGEDAGAVRTQPILDGKRVLCRWDPPARDH